MLQVLGVQNELSAQKRKCFEILAPFLYSQNKSFVVYIRPECPL